MQLRNLLPLVSMATLLACKAVPSEKTDMSTDKSTASAAGQASWQPLFNGKTAQGWHTYGQERAGEAWEVEDGTLHLSAAAKKSGLAGGDLVTEETFGDFHLKLEWKIAPNGNSGIILFVQEDAAKYQQTWHTGPEIQVLDNDGHPDAKINKHRAGDLYDLIASSPETVKPAGQWNQLEIISTNNTLEVLQNGQKVLSTTMWDDNWRSLIAGSKFKEMNGFGAFKSGKIALQDHGDDAWFRNLMIKRL